jgi:ABC-2 type transport system permease protein
VKHLLVIATREFRVHVRQRGFLLSTIGLPVLLIAVLFLPQLFGTGGQPAPAANPIEPAMIGYVDEADIIRHLPDDVGPNRLIPFESEQGAIAALRDGRVEAYYVVEPDYRETGSVRRVSKELPSSPPDQDIMESVLIANVVSGVSQTDLARLRSPFGRGGLQTRQMDSAGEQTQSGLPLVPFILTMAIVTPLFTGGSYLFRSLTEEKKSRALEMLLVSIRPRQLLLGKVVGTSGLVLVQYLGWGVIAAVVQVLRQGGPRGLLGGLAISSDQLLLAVPFGIGGFLLYAGLMAGIGALADDVEETRVWVFVLTLPMLAPIYLWSTIATAPNGPLSVALSLFPFSAPVAMTLRLMSASVPPWQAWLGVGLLFVAALGMIVLMSARRMWQALITG